MNRMNLWFYSRKDVNPLQRAIELLIVLVE
jgi:hypothetical protein